MFYYPPLAVFGIEWWLNKITCTPGKMLNDTLLTVGSCSHDEPG
jgi:hypothetical protein